MIIYTKIKFNKIIKLLFLWILALCDILFTAAEFNSPICSNDK